MKKNKTSSLFIPLAGFVAGAVNGMLGAGGGIIIIYSLARLLGENIPDRRDIYANALCVMLPISVVSSIIYAVRGSMRIDGFGAYVLPAVIGGVIGGYLLGKLNADFLKKLFAALVVYSGVMLIIK